MNNRINLSESIIRAIDDANSGYNHIYEAMEDIEPILTGIDREYYRQFKFTRDNQEAE